MTIPGSVTRRQSIFIALVMLGGFFLGGIYLVKRQSGKYTIATTPDPLPSEKIVRSQPTAASIVPPLGTSGAGEASGFLLNEFHRSQIKDGRTIWEVRGSKGQYFPAENKAIVSDARLILSRTPEEHVTVEAGEATLYLRGTELLRADIVHDVVLNYKDDVLVKTDHAIFDQTKNTVTAPGLVQISQEIIDVAGESLIADLSTQEFNLQRNVVTTVKPRSAK